MATVFIVYQFYPFNKSENRPDQVTIGNHTLLNDLEKAVKPTKVIEKKPLKSIEIQNELERTWFANNYQNDNVSSYMEELFLAVDKENPIAQYHLAYIHRECQNVPQNKDKLYSDIAGMRTEEGMQHWLDLYNFCDGYPRNKITQKDIINYTMAAARAGHPEAKFEFQAVAFMGMSPDDVLEKAELIVELKHESFQHLLDTRNMGHKSSLMHLGMAYEDGALIEKDLIEAYAYYYAHNEVNLDADGRLLDMVGHQLSNEEIEVATERGIRYAQCCE